MPSVDERRDQDIARAALTEIRSDLPISWESINVAVRHGWLTLEGQAGGQYQRPTAENAVHRIGGVKGVSNLIELTPRTQLSEIEEKIKEAYVLNTEAEANRCVAANPSERRLKGML